MVAKKKISVEDYSGRGLLKSRRNKPVTPSYIYRLIRQHQQGKRDSVPFDYELEGPKERVWIIL